MKNLLFALLAFVVGIVVGALLFSYQPSYRVKMAPVVQYEAKRVLALHVSLQSPAGDNLGSFEYNQNTHDHLISNGIPHIKYHANGYVLIWDPQKGRVSLPFSGEIQLFDKYSFEVTEGDRKFVCYSSSCTASK